MAGWWPGRTGQPPGRPADYPVGSIAGTISTTRAATPKACRPADHWPAPLRPGAQRLRPNGLARAGHLGSGQVERRTGCGRQQPARRHRSGLRRPPPCREPRPPDTATTLRALLVTAKVPGACGHHGVRAGPARSTRHRTRPSRPQILRHWYRARHPLSRNIDHTSECDTLCVLEINQRTR